MDQIIEYIRLAFRNIKANLLRTILTCLIIAFGIMALVGIQTIITSLGNQVASIFSPFGTNQFSITNQSNNVSSDEDQKPYPPISYEQASEFKHRLNFPSKITVSIQRGGNIEVKSKYEKSNPNYQVIGADENHLIMKNKEIEYGRDFSTGEVESGQNVAIIPAGLVSKLFKGFGPRDVLGEELTIRNHRYRIIGVLKDKGESFGEGSNFVMLPLATVHDHFGSPTSNYEILVGVNSESALQPAMNESKSLMKVVRNLKITDDNNFDVSYSDAANQNMKEVLNSVSMGGLLIGIITLTGAAIGLMNILLVSVTERVREIGICKAIGATVQSIRLQFFIEGILISIMGGILGIILGLLAGRVISHFTKSKFTIPWDWVGIGLTICLFVGLISSIYPAIKASRLKPIDALRQD